MALITRLSRLLTADFHAVLDRMEEPDILLQQAIREMEADLLDREAEIRHLQQQRKRLAHRQEEMAESLPNLQEELTLCLESGNEDLARVLVRRKLEAENFSKHAVTQLQTVEQELLEVQSKFNEDQTSLEGLRQKADVFASRNTTADGHELPVSDVLVTEHDVEVALLKEKHKRQVS